MPRRSIWKGSFVYAFLLRMKKKISLLLNRKIGSRRSSILPEFVDCSVRIYNVFVVRSLKKRLVIKRVCFYTETKTFENKGKK